MARRCSQFEFYSPTCHRKHSASTLSMLRRLSHPEPVNEIMQLRRQVCACFLNGGWGSLFMPLAGRVEL